MKNLKKWSFILIPLMFVAIVSCKHSANNNGTFVGSDKKPLTITVTSNDHIQLFKNRSAARVISADAFNTSDHLHFYLWGTASNGQTLAPAEVDVIPGEDVYHGKVVLNIGTYNWELTLAACATAPATVNETNILTNAVLIGYGNVDMRFTENILFTLSPRGLTNPGETDFALNFESGIPATDYTITANIYDIITGKPVLSDEETPASLKMTIKAEDDSWPLATAPKYNANGKKIKPGTYSFNVEFEKGGKSFVTNETIIILPGKKIETPVNILNPIGLVPAAPEGFTVQFNQFKTTSNGSLTTEKEDTVVGKYLAHFSWDGDEVNTEKNFKLELVEVSGNDAVTAMTDSDTTAAATNWASLLGASTKKFEFSSKEQIAREQMYKSGSLFHDSTWVDLYLDLGKRYIARLYSENDAGLSATPSYVVISPYDTGATTMTTINRYRVHYYNKKGTWSYSGDTPTTSTDEIVTYWSQSNAAYKVLNPKDDTAGANSTNPYLLKNGTSKWLHWTTKPTSDVYPAYTDDDSDPDTPDVYIPVDYTDYKNLNLYANYSGDIEIWNDADYKILPDWVAGFGIDAGSISQTAKNDFSKGNNTSTTVTLTVPTSTTDTWNYDKVFLTIRFANNLLVNDVLDVVAARGTANTFTINLNDFAPGMYYCNLSAQYKQTLVDYPFTIYLTD